MTGHMSRNSVLAAILGVALLAPAAAFAGQNPTLGELALKEQERRKALKASGAGKVVTNGDLPRGVVPPPPAPDTVVPKPEADRAADPAKPAEPAEPAKDESWWKARMNQEREMLRRNEMFAEALQTR